MKPLKDTDKMPFGKFQGVSMANVPGKYFLYWYNYLLTVKPTQGASKAVFDYIEDNREVIEAEAKEKLKKWA